MVERVWKNIRTKGGKTVRRFVQIDDKGRWKFLKSPSKPVPKTGKANRGRKEVKTKERSPRKFTLPVAIVAGLGAGLWPVANLAIQGRFSEAFSELSARYTGYHPASGTWWIGNMYKGLLPLIAGLLVHRFVGGSPLNLNRALGQARVPIFRI